MLPGALIVGWWIWDLSYQWRSLVEYQYGWIVVLLTGFLIWERMPTRPLVDEPEGFPLCFGLAVAGMPLVALGELYRIGVARTPASSMCLSLGIALFLSANLLYAGGRRTFRHFVFPLVFFFLAVPIPKIVWNPIVFSLQSMITWLNVETLNLMGIPAMKVGHVIQLPRCTVGVDEACSGIRSLQSSLMAALFVGDLMLRRPGSRVVFLVAGLVLAVIGNFLRSLYLSLTANRLGPEGLKAVHDTAGWSVLIFTAAGVVALAWWFTRKEDRLQREAEASLG
ncbi:MAG: exosortase/archaeosortase family protein [Verrucomicrobiota bacterium]